MIYVGGKFLYVAFAMAARDAARRFMFHFVTARGSRDGWCPVVLRWRRKSKGRKEVSTERRAPAVNVRWFPQFHLHFATYLSNSAPPDRTAALVPDAGNQHARVVLDHHWISVRAANVSPTQPRSPQPTRGTSAKRGSFSPLRAADSDAARVSWRPTAQLMTSFTVLPQRPLGSLRMRSAVRPNAQRDERTRPFKTHAPIQHHWLQLWSMRPSRVGNDVSLPTPQRKPSHSHFDRIEELVWRRVTRTATDVAARARDSEFSDSYVRTPVRSLSGEEPASNLSPRVERASPQQLLQLDPAALDRLTDDVIRRMEKRMRIERQRRGL